MAKSEIVSDFMTSRELATRLGYGTIPELWKQVRQGAIPLPHSRRGRQIFVWRRSWYEEYLKTGRWPRDVAYQPAARAS